MKADLMRGTAIHKCDDGNIGLQWRQTTCNVTKSSEKKVYKIDLISVLPASKGAINKFIHLFSNIVAGCNTMAIEWHCGKYAFTGKYTLIDKTPVNHTYVLLSDCYHVKTLLSHIHHSKNEQPIKLRLKWLTFDGSFHTFFWYKKKVSPSLHFFL